MEQANYFLALNVFWKKKSLDIEFKIAHSPGLFSLAVTFSCFIYILFNYVCI